MNIHALDVSSPLGVLQLVSDEKHLLELNWQCVHRQLSTSNHRVAILSAAADELSQFFSGARRNFSVPLQPHGTGFQLSVWSELQKVGWGETSTYREIAERLGKPKGFRAVGGAVGRNPIPIFIPCHRIVGANGALTGFSGGLDNKQILLGYEGH
jgi:methylated-DNA-[protein]-cysteine S-methyltransferase